jgi:DNA-binding NarL/FixJ family response regulator
MNIMNNHQVITLLIVGDNHIVRSGLRRIFESGTRIAVIGDVGIRGAVHASRTLGHHPDVVLIDLDAEGTDALVVMSGLLRNLKNSTIVVMGGLGNDERIRKAIELGAAGVVLKVQPPSVLIAAIEGLFSRPNERIEAPELDHSPNSIPKTKEVRSDPDAARITTLTERERDIVALIASGLKNKDIAERLHISDITVRHHLTNVFVKMGVSDRQKLLLLAYRHGLDKPAFHSEEP